MYVCMYVCIWSHTAFVGAVDHFNVWYLDASTFDSSRQVHTVPHGPTKSLHVELSVKTDYSKTWFPDRSSSFAELSLKTRHKSKKAPWLKCIKKKPNQKEWSEVEVCNLTCPDLSFQHASTYLYIFQVMTSDTSWCHTAKAHPMLSFETSQPQEARDRQSWSVRKKSPSEKKNVSHHDTERTDSAVSDTIEYWSILVKAPMTHLPPSLPSVNVLHLKSRTTIHRHPTRTLLPLPAWTVNSANGKPVTSDPRGGTLIFPHSCCAWLGFDFMAKLSMTMENLNWDSGDGLKLMDFNGF